MRPRGEQRQRRRTRMYEQARTHAETRGLTPLSDSPIGFARVAVDESEELRPWTEIEQQPNLEVGGSKVVEELFPVRFHESLRCLELDDDLVLDHQVSSEVADAEIVVPHLDDFLTFDRESESCQLVRERPPIYGLEEPESEPIVNAMKHQRIWRVSSCSKRDPSACVREGFIRVSLR